MTTIQPRDDDILRTLSLKVRLFSLEQLAASWWTDTRSGKDNARKRLRALGELGLVSIVRPLARPLPELKSPLIRWTPGDPEPEFSAAAWVLKSRWTEPARQVTAYIATAAAAGLYGGRVRGRLKHDYQATHDLGLSAVYLLLRRTRPELESRWIGEDLLHPLHVRKKIPDAVLARTPRDIPELVIEFGGAYDTRRLRTIHKDCKQKKLPYEIW